MVTFSNETIHEFLLTPAPASCQNVLIKTVMESRADAYIANHHT